MDILEEIHIEHIGNQLSRLNRYPTTIYYSVKSMCIIVEYGEGITLKYGNTKDNKPFIYLTIRLKIGRIPSFNKKYENLYLSENDYLDNLCSSKHCICTGGQYYVEKCPNSKYFSTMLKSLISFVNIWRLLS